MKFNYGRQDFRDFERGEENGYLLTNGLGGYSSATIVGSNSRNDHALLMAAVTAPNYRVHLLTKVEEILTIGESEYDLSAQKYVEYSKNQEGFHYLNHFVMDHLPTWLYQAGGVEICKTLVMKHGENTLGISYDIINRSGKDALFNVYPWVQFVPKGDMPDKKQKFLWDGEKISSNDFNLYYRTNGIAEGIREEWIRDLYYEYDARDGRPSIGSILKNHRIKFRIPAGERVQGEIVYSLQENFEPLTQMIEEEVERQEKLIQKAGITDSVAQTLVKSCSQFISNRDSTRGKTILAGYPFFADWGRDTMIAINGCCIATGQQEDAKSILKTFINSLKNGIMPNLFPEGENKPEYNTVDASLLFILSVYEYYQTFGDLAFIKTSAFSAIEEILMWYQKGTDYHICMDTDGLLMAGSDYEQLTWMDVRIDKHLPTPRHGKPVEINAYWYNGLMIASYFANLLNKESKNYETLAIKVKESFQKEFWLEEQGYLCDVVGKDEKNTQFRCNQIWAISQPFSLLDRAQEIKVVNQVYEKLYTPQGLRTLEEQDAEFKGFYGGRQGKRDMAYHQGTVWPFPQGAYYLAYLKVQEWDKEAISIVKRQLEVVPATLREGCCGQIAEIYDGSYPTQSKGCFAQAWSLGELLKVYRKIQEHE